MFMDIESAYNRVDAYNRLDAYNRVDVLCGRLKNLVIPNILVHFLYKLKSPKISKTRVVGIIFQIFLPLLTTAVNSSLKNINGFFRIKAKAISEQHQKTMVPKTELW